MTNLKSDMLAIGTAINFAVCNLFILFVRKWFILWLILFIIIEILLIGREYIKPTVKNLRARFQSGGLRGLIGRGGNVNGAGVDNTVLSSPIPPIINTVPIVEPSSTPSEDIGVTAIQTSEPIENSSSKEIPRPFLCPSTMMPPSSLPGSTVALSGTEKSSEVPNVVAPGREKSSKVPNVVAPESPIAETNVQARVRPYTEPELRSEGQLATRMGTPTVSVISSVHQAYVARPEPFTHVQPRPLATPKERSYDLVVTANMEESVGLLSKSTETPDTIEKTQPEISSATQPPLEIPSTEISVTIESVSDSINKKESRVPEIKKPKGGRKDVKRRGIRLKSIPPTNG